MPGIKLPPIDGPREDFARMVRDITGEVARQTAATRGNVSHDTIARMWRGEIVSESTILRFAAGYKVDPNPLLRAAGYRAVVNYGERVESEPGQNRIVIKTGDPFTLVWEDEPGISETHLHNTPELRDLIRNLGIIQQGLGNSGSK